MKFKKNILLDYLHTFFRSFNATQGIWLIYLYARGFSIFEIAIFEGIFHVTSLFLEIPTGAVADLFGRKTSRLIGIVMYLVYITILLNSTSFALVGLSFVFCALSFVFESGAAEALVYDSMIQTEETDTFMRFLGKKEFLYQVSGFLALVASGTIALLGYNWNFFVTGFMYVIAFVLILNMKEPPIENKTQEEEKRVIILMKKQFVTSFKIVFQNKRLFLLLVIGSMMTAPVTSIFFYFQNYFDLTGVPIYLITIYIGLHSGVAAIGGLLAHKIDKKLGERKILFLVPLILTICFWFILIPSISINPFIILGLLDSIFYIVLVDYINRMVSSEVRATVLSVFGMMFSIVMIVLFTVIGYIIDTVSFEMGFLILAIIVTLFFVFSLFVIRGNHLEDKKEV